MSGTASRTIASGGRFRLFAGMFPGWGGGSAAAASALAIAASLLGAPASASAQLKVEGEVLDAVTGVPVAGVIVHFPDLGLGTISDEMGYFAFNAVPRDSQVVATHHMGYRALLQEVPIVDGETWLLKLTPKPVELDGVTVEADRAEAIEAARTGRRSDFISPTAVAEAAERTNKVLEVFRTKAPPRLQIRQQGGPGGITFCIQSTRRAPSVQELTDLGNGCHPALLVLDGVVVYSPPAMTEMARIEPPSLPGDVAALLLNQNPQEIESIRILSRSDAFFRYGEIGRLGAVEIKTRHPGRPRGG
ncbi:MAG: carboxypeptidase-like regulatory domain-containing protein [Gemmatimonadetes bacterium]|nr:carboxypeptidase-like regulatory domain-containing protein [Gemmatimonadota bacterium]MYG35852.1 carboxypeptidase-like regulatory domain-containing protein [Gemmatimonadota bacterium]